MFSLSFETDNAAFDDGNAENEIARILRGIAETVHRTDGGLIHDVNGNQIGTWDYEPEAKDQG